MVISYLIVIVGIVLIFGRFGDMFGKFKMFIFGLGLFIFGFLLCGIISLFIVLILVRVV